ncbi:MAG: ROK family transcriptional regulator, partial [Fidelibacterota bacterium]
MIPEAHLIKKGDSSYLKKVNETRLLYIIYKEGPVSRVDLSREASMSKAAVSEIINRLCDAGMLQEVGKGQSTSKGGKRPTLIRLNPDRGYVFGLEIKRSETIIALANIDGDLLNTSVIEYEAGSPVSTILRRIIREMENVLALKKISYDRLIAIGIGAPGQINYDEGNLLVADTLKNWAHEPISGVFQETFHVPVILENDVNT